MTTNHNNANDLIIFPATDIGYSEILHFLKSMQDHDLLHRLLLICPADFFKAHRINILYHIDDECKSYSVLIQKIQSWANANHCSFRGIIAIDEEKQFKLSRRIARHFKLDFYPEETCSLASNKYMQKLSFLKLKVLTGDFLLISDADDSAGARLGFPNVMKIMSGNGSQYMFCNENMQRLKHNFQCLRTAAAQVRGDTRFFKQRALIDGESITLNPRRQFLLEAYIQGQEFSCDFRICSGAVQIIRVVRKVHGPYFGYFLGYHLLNEKDTSQYDIDLGRLKKLCERIARALAVQTGVCMVDLIMKGRDWYVLEASIRPGLSAFNHLMYETYGYTSLFLMAMQQLGMAMDIHFPAENGAVIYLYTRDYKNIRAVDTSALETLRQKFNIIHFHQYKDMGDDRIDPLMDQSRLIWGYVLLKNIDGSALPHLAKALNEKIKIIRKNE